MIIHLTIRFAIIRFILAINSKFKIWGISSGDFVGRDYVGGFCLGGFCRGGGILSGGFRRGGILSGRFCRGGGIVSGGFCRGGFRRSTVFNLFEFQLDGLWVARGHLVSDTLAQLKRFRLRTSFQLDEHTTTKRVDVINIPVNSQYNPFYGYMKNEIFFGIILMSKGFFARGRQDVQSALLGTNVKTIKKLIVYVPERGCIEDITILNEIVQYYFWRQNQSERSHLSVSP